jgi:hypothetical protein
MHDNFYPKSIIDIKSSGENYHGYYKYYKAEYNVSTGLEP